MMRDKHEKYSKGSYATSELIRIHNPNIYKVLQWLETKLKPSEVINILYRTRKWFYVGVEDSNIKQSIPEVMGFIVDIGKDIITLNNDKSDYRYGNGCFVRANKWKPHLKKFFGTQYNKHTFDIYKDPRPLNPKQ
jgi:hypothetical protein